MYRKIEDYIENYLKSDEQKVLCIKGARRLEKVILLEKNAKNTLKITLK